MKTCEYCFKIIDEDKNVLKYGGYYFCSEKCLEEYRKEDEVFEFTDFDYEEEDTFLSGNDDPGFSMEEDELEEYEQENEVERAE